MFPRQDRAVFDPEEGLRVQVRPGGLAHLAGRDGGDSLGPVLRLVETLPESLELEQPLGALFDGLIIEDVGAGQVALGPVISVLRQRAP